MRRAAFGLIFLVPGLVVLWTGLDLPPPLWIFEYGLPGSQRPTGRVFHVEGIDFVEISPGYFRLGSDYLAIKSLYGYGCTVGDVLGRFAGHLGLSWGSFPRPSDEMPVHWVQFRRPFAIAKTEITNQQYERYDPGHRQRRATPGNRTPFIQFNWPDITAYLAWLSRRAGHPVRLPSEAEWECACRAGSTTSYCYGNDRARLVEYARYDDGAGPLPVASLRPNAWGLYDMHGNAMEICEDTWHESYVGAPADGTAWSMHGPPEDHVARGGSFAFDALSVRSASRMPCSYGTNKSFSWPEGGVRLVLLPGPAGRSRP